MRIPAGWEEWPERGWPVVCVREWFGGEWRFELHRTMRGHAQVYLFGPDAVAVALNDCGPGKISDVVATAHRHERNALACLAIGRFFRELRREAIVAAYLAGAPLDELVQS